MTELKKRIETLKNTLAQSINSSGLPLEVAELALDFVHIQLINQVKSMTDPEEEKKKGDDEE